MPSFCPAPLRPATQDAQNSAGWGWVPRMGSGLVAAGGMRLYPHSLPLRGTRPPYRAIQNPRGRRCIETIGRASDERDTPAAQILIERRGVVEHVAHFPDAADVPRTNVLIERRGVYEHVAHVRDAANVPRTDVQVRHRSLQTPVLALQILQMSCPGPPSSLRTPSATGSTSAR